MDSNRTQIVENNVEVATYYYDAAQRPGVDQLWKTTVGGSTTIYSYDTRGNTTARGGDSLSWDGRGRHSGGTFGGTSVTYEFDASGFRRKRVGGGSERRYYLGGVVETDSAGTVVVTSVAGAASDVAHYAGNPTGATSVAFVYLNGHGDVAATADTAGVRTAAYTYDPFGAAKQSVPVNTTTERWTGRWDKKLDTSTALIEMGVRPYDPSLGRFLAVDPVEGGSLNNYDYAGQDPISSYDLDGMRKCRGWRRWMCKVGQLLRNPIAQTILGAAACTLTAGACMVGALAFAALNASGCRGGFVRCAGGFALDAVGGRIKSVYSLATLRSIGFRRLGRTGFAYVSRRAAYLTFAQSFAFNLAVPVGAYNASRWAFHRWTGI